VKVAQLSQVSRNVAFIGSWLGVVETVNAKPAELEWIMNREGSEAVRRRAAGVLER
jgi:hypothetical protein